MAAEGQQVDIVIPTYNNLDQLRDCLRSVAAQPEATRAIVCVDGSTDGTLEWLRSEDCPLEPLVLEHADQANHGRAATRNLALRHLEAPIVLLLDSDLELTPRALRQHLVLLDARDCVSIGDVVYLNAATNQWARYLATRGKNKARPGQEVRPLDFNTQNVALRTSHLRAAGEFDESLPVYGGEDTEMGLRLAELQRLPLIFNGNAVATAVEGKTVTEGLAQLRAFGRFNLRTIRARHPSGPGPFWIHRLESHRLIDRALVALLNPATDLVVDFAIRVPWFPLQRILLNYKVLRAVWSGYREGTA